MTLHWLMRAKRWAQHPPSAGRVRLVAAVVALCLGLALVEWAIGWPEWLRVDPMPQGRAGG